jgi:tRNA pseudouridine38-40 synthase
VTGPDPLLRHMALAWHRPVDIDAVNEASALLVGEHDFVAFCKQREGATTVRRLLDLRWERDAFGDAVMTITSDAFCHSMVRSIVGSLLPVGDHRKPTSWPHEILVSQNKTAGVTVMPPHPLVLEEVGYPPEDQWAIRQLDTRNLRT